MPDPPLLFVHVPKTAGTSLRSILVEHYGTDGVYPESVYTMAQKEYFDAYTNVERLLKEPDLDRYGAITGHLPAAVTGLLPMAVRTFTLLRHPVERTLSLLANLQLLTLERSGRKPSLELIYDDPFINTWMFHDAQTRIFGLSPDQFASGWCWSEGSEATPADPDECEVRRLRGLIRDMPLVSTALVGPVPTDDAMLKAAMVRLDAIDLVGVQERFGAFLAGFAIRFGVAVPSVPNLNVTPERTPVSKWFRRIIEADNELDMELYEYARTLAV